MIDSVVTCPLGAECEVVKDNVIHRCAWYVEMKGIDAAGDDHEESKCAIAWMPILQTEVSKETRLMTAAVVSTRNEQVARQDLAIKVMQEMPQ